MKYATIDIGTNTALILVGRWQGGELDVLWDEARITRLGESLHRLHHFLPQAEERTLAVLREYRRLSDSYKVEKIAAVGTAAFRKARNAPAFIERIEKETGIRIEVISGPREAALSYLSVKHDFGIPPIPPLKLRGGEGGIWALDIGGGSTEVISEEDEVSLDLGTVTLTEKIFRHDPPTEREFEAIVKTIQEGIQFPVPVGPTPTLVGLAGSVTTLSAIRQKLEVWDGRKIQGSILTITDLGEMVKLFRRTTNEERRTIPGMVRGREETILAGTLILKTVMERLGVDRVTVSDRGLRYGLFYERFSR